MYVCMLVASKMQIDLFIFIGKFLDACRYTYSVASKERQGDMYNTSNDKQYSRRAARFVSRSRADVSNRLHVASSMLMDAKIPAA